MFFLYFVFFSQHVLLIENICYNICYIICYNICCIECFLTTYVVIKKHQKHMLQRMLHSMLQHMLQQRNTASRAGFVSPHSSLISSLDTPPTGSPWVWVCRGFQTTPSPLIWIQSQLRSQIRGVLLKNNPPGGFVVWKSNQGGWFFQRTTPLSGGCCSKVKSGGLFRIPPCPPFKRSVVLLVLYSTILSYLSSLLCLVFFYISPLFSFLLMSLLSPLSSFFSLQVSSPLSSL